MTEVKFNYQRVERSDNQCISRFYHNDVNLDDAIIHAQIDTFDEALQWCAEQFGSTGERWYAYSWAVFIRSDADATAFRLRWC